MSKNFVEYHVVEDPVCVNKEFQDLRFQVTNTVIESSGEREEEEEEEIVEGGSGDQQQGYQSQQYLDQLKEQEENAEYIIHKVGKLDTLVGLAVKYNVSMQNIRRANNIVSDTSIYTKDTLIIPKQTLPIDQELMTRAAYIVSGYDRSVNFGQKSRQMPGTSALFKQAGPEIVRDFWESHQVSKCKLDFPGDLVRDDSILPLNGEHHSDSSLIDVAAQFEHKNKELSPRGRQWKLQMGGFQGNSYSGFIGRSQQAYQSIGQTISQLGKKIVDAANSPALCGDNYKNIGFADLSDTIISGRNPFRSRSEKSFIKQEMTRAASQKPEYSYKGGKGD